MVKKYLPFIALILAAALLWYVKKHQGPRSSGPFDNTKIQVDPVSPERRTADEPFNRRDPRLIYSKHARCRMDCRHIDESEVKEILEIGRINYSKVETSARGTSYPLEGTTHDSQKVRIVFAPSENGLVVVTCIDLDKDWPCDCK